MVFKVDELYIITNNEEKAFLHYVGYRRAMTKANLSDKPIDVNMDVIKVADHSVEEFFKPIFEKIKDEHPGSYYGHYPDFSTSLVIKEENDKDLVVTIQPIADGVVYQLCVGFLTDDEYQLTIICSTEDPDDIIDTVNDVIDIYSLRMN